MTFVIIETPYAGDVVTNVVYARACLRHSLLLGEAPFASHLLYTQPGVLDDLKVDERNLGIGAGLELAKRADLTVVYTDHGISDGMQRGIDAARAAGRPLVYRCLYPPELKR